MAAGLFLTLSAPYGNAYTSRNSTSRQSYSIYVDDNGVMRRNDNHSEVSYYGTNYTLPFAHAYRALPLMGMDRKKTIDLDVLHFKRLSFNGFRLHLWDVELSDSIGNLLSNDHLDLLDYLIARLEMEGIDIVLTAQTNFGNGYPEKNIDTGAYSYDFDKCNIHENPEAQKIQERYLRQLAEHINPYTGLSYGSDKAIIAIEINNEPCHSGSCREVTQYIDRMAEALRKGGFDRIILYNVSHNRNVVSAYYNSDIQGTTYQWYPDGLVAGHERQGNLLPYVDDYNIPWKDSIPNFHKMARLIYEFDPGDVLCTYLYPAVARTFRKQGFQWATQFAYDPTPIAAFNTEYQTHFLNLLYTPGKAIGMAIAAEAMRNIPRGSDYGIFPKDTVFGDFRVSYSQDLSLYNSDHSFYHSNSTIAVPKDLQSLTHIKGTGNSPVVTYPGSGAYFLDRLSEDGVWRLEVMPDVAIYRDPFEKTSLLKPLASLYYACHPMTIRIPGLGDTFEWELIADGIDEIKERPSGTARASEFNVIPGVYILARDRNTLDYFNTTSSSGAESNYCAPRNFILSANGINPVPTVIHTPLSYCSAENPLEIRAEVYSDTEPLSVTVYPSDISFWREDNTLYEMNTEDGVNYHTVIPAEVVGRNGFSYNIVVTVKDGEQYTYLARTPGNPLGWDIITTEYYTTAIADPAAPFLLFRPQSPDTALDVAMIPEEYSYRWRVTDNAPYGNSAFELTATPSDSGVIAIKKYIGNRSHAPALHLHDKNMISVLTTTALPEGSIVSITCGNGLTYSACLGEYNDMHRYDVRISDLKLSPTMIIPAPYPTFLKREFIPAPQSSGIPDLDDMEFVQLTVPVEKDRLTTVSLEYIWME